MRSRALLAASVFIMAAGPLAAQTNVIWGNNAGNGPDQIESFNKTTGTRTNLFNGGTVSSGTGNGRGIVVVGNTIYYTMLNSNFTGDFKIHTMDATTGIQGPSITTTVQTFSTLAYDGTGFWTSEYLGGNHAYHLSMSGVIDKTITLSNATPGVDGMEFFNGKLIANRGDGSSVYDIYDLNGNVLTSSFINTGGFTTGIAYDGTNFFVSALNSLKVYSGTTGAFMSTIALNPTVGTIEDLSVDYATRIDIPPPVTTTPEPASLVLFGSGLIGVLSVVRRKRNNARAA